MLACLVDEIEQNLPLASETHPAFGRGLSG
jgi:hypothetical protein